MIGELIRSAPLWVYGEPPAMLLWLTVAAVFLGFFDISLPRGDTLGISGTIDVVALLTMGVRAALFVSVAGAVTTVIARRSPGTGTGRLVAGGSRLVGLGLAAVLLALLQPSMVAAPWLVALVVLLQHFADLMVSHAITAVLSRRSLRRAMRGSLSSHSALLLSQSSAALLGVIVLPMLGAWGLLLVVALLMIIRQSYALLQEVRETYKSTVEVLVEVAEGADPARKGHAERTAFLAREIAGACNLAPSEVERVSYAALLHDIGQIGTGAASGAVESPSAPVIEGVGYLEDVVGVVRVMDDPAGEDAPADPDVLHAYIVALASDIDAQAEGVPHGGRAAGIARLCDVVPSPVKARVVGAALELGYGVPAVP